MQSSAPLIFARLGNDSWVWSPVPHAYLHCSNHLKTCKLPPRPLVHLLPFFATPVTDVSTAESSRRVELSHHTAIFAFDHHHHRHSTGPSSAEQATEDIESVKVAPYSPPSAYSPPTLAAAGPGKSGQSALLRTSSSGNGADDDQVPFSRLQAARVPSPALKLDIPAPAGQVAALGAARSSSSDHQQRPDRQTKLGRSGTITARHHSRASSGVSEAGYDAERDQDSDGETPSQETANEPAARDFAAQHVADSAASTPTTSPRAFKGKMSSDHPHRPNRPSMPHAFPRSHLPHGPRPGSHPPPKRRSSSRTGSSISSRRSSLADVAASHPFPTPGLKDTRQLEAYKSVEEKRLEESEKKKRHWKRWGPYLSERQWATVREDYSANGDAWTHFPHDHARSRTYRWGEDGLGGISDNHGRLCFSIALWNQVDPILKERLFGVTGHQGNHGEDVKEIYYYLDSTPTHSYMRYLYKYPQRPYPYDELVRQSTNRGRDVQEFEILDTDAFDDNKYWDVYVEYAKDADNENAISIRITAYNRGPDPATLHIVPQTWFRNTWSWGKERPKGSKMPSMHASGDVTVALNHKELGRLYLHAQPSPAPAAAPSKKGEVVEIDEEVKPDLLFTENETNFERLYGGTNRSFAKDAFHDHIIPSHRPPPIKKQSVNGKDEKAAQTNGSEGDSEHSSSEHSSAETTPQPERVFVNPDRQGTKAAAHYVFRDVPANGGCAVVRLKLSNKTADQDPTVEDEELFDATVDERRQDADEFYARFNSSALNDDLRSIMRQALSGMLWTKQFYYFVQKEWIEGDPGQPPPPPERKWIRNRDWKHMYIEDVLSMPDKWEYPFFAAWDTAFHCIPLAMVDPAYAKNQLDIMTREWYMKPDGALPAYEWNFSDVNPPVHAWATFRVFKIERKMHGREDVPFLERVFQKLLLNFTWWVNRKDANGQNVFEGGFLGLDNIGLFNRSEPLPTGGVLRQADGTAWMAFFALNMLNMALELAKHNPVYEDIASKFFEHFLFISQAMTYGDPNDSCLSLWNEEDGFYYDAISWGPGNSRQVPVRSLVGLIPLYATLTLEPGVLKRFPGFKKRMDWFIENRPDMASKNIANMRGVGRNDRKLLALASEERLKRILEKMLDETEFLGEHGIRTLSRYHKEHPYHMTVNGEDFSVEYWPGDSHSGMFGGNSNWRSPYWLAPIHLLVESLHRFYQYYGPDLKVECPKGSGDYMNLAGVADEIQHRVIHLFSRDVRGRRACNGGSDRLDYDPNFRDHVFFHEFFHAETGKGLGASHQTGWTGLVSWFIFQSGASARLPRTPRTPRSSADHYFGESLPPTPAASDFSDAGSEMFEHMSASEFDPDEL